jgi:hypothetical protein
VKFLVNKNTTQTTCLRLMGKKMLVALMMEGKFLGEGIHSLESDDDLMSAMARELVERCRVGESADAVWADLKRERDLHAPSRRAEPIQDRVTDAEEMLAEMPLFLAQPESEPSDLTAVHSAEQEALQALADRPDGNGPDASLRINQRARSASCGPIHLLWMRIEAQR